MYRPCCGTFGLYWLCCTWHSTTQSQNRSIHMIKKMQSTSHMLVRIVEAIRKPATLIIFEQPYSISYNVTPGGLWHGLHHLRPFSAKAHLRFFWGRSPKPTFGFLGEGLSESNPKEGA